MEANFADCGKFDDSQCNNARESHLLKSLYEKHVRIVPRRNMKMGKLSIT